MSSALRLEGRAAVVTGASGGIGRAVALEFAREGASVVAHYHSSAEPAEELVARIREDCGTEAIAVRADIARRDEIDEMVRTGLERFGRLDIWANIAGYDILTGPGRELRDVEKLDRLIAVDLRGTVLASWAAAEALEDGGVILNMSWDRAIDGVAGREAELFAAVKGGISSFSRSLALSLAPRIRVNVLAPGWIKTAFFDTLNETARDRILESIPLRRWGTPEDVARAAVFLATPDSGYVTGQTLLIGGGETMQ